MVEAIEWARAVVLEAEAAHPGLQKLVCRADDARVIPAIAYTELVGEIAPGQVVWLNVRALSLRLGTGGVAFVIGPGTGGGAPLAGRTADAAGPAAGGDAADSGFLVKARYTPLQVAKPGVDSPLSPHHAVMRRADSLAGLPVVVADLHSSLPAICAGILHDAAARGWPPPRLVYVMTDGAALPLAYSDTVARLVADGSLAATVTAGQAFGGDFEAISVHSALLAARHVTAADVVICVQGPGNLGGDTRWGFSGVAVGEAVNAAAVLGGRPVGCLRVSGADRRPRHRGLSHHSLTAYGRVALAPADLALPIFDGDLAALGAQVEVAARPLAARHRLVRVPLDGLTAALERVPDLSTMGRRLADDPAAFLAAAAAGRLALNLLHEPPAAASARAAAGGGCLGR
ncbi:MAG: DUF3866 family protein [Bifidobacteriaceae bacterium]|nr:DUF3866 family protein [Bifidobacteriaceae bacterium]